MRYRLPIRETVRGRPRLGGQLPLTPALSPREREQPGAALGQSHIAGFLGRPTTILPLPEGEGLEFGQSCFELIRARARAESAAAYQPRVTPWESLKPRRGGLPIAPAEPPSLFLFFSGAALARLSNSPPAAPLKNKKKGGGSRSSYKQVTPTGFLAPGARRRWYESPTSKRCASISSSRPSPGKMWVKASPERARPTEATPALAGRAVPLEAGFPGRCLGLMCPHAVGVQNVQTPVFFPEGEGGDAARGQHMGYKRRATHG
jgi:hypothetical protein